MQRDLTADDWSALKTLWSDYEFATPAERQSLLEKSSASLRVRQWLHELAGVEETDLEIIEGGAIRLLGFDANAEDDGVAARAATLVGRRLGPYEVRRLIARGGMGSVYEAHRADDAYRHRVAIKTVWRGVDSEVLQQRFLSERQILAGLQHPNIAQLLDGGSTEEGTPWLALEYVDGVPIDAWCDSQQLGIVERLDLFRQVCAAVQHAHRCLVIHRDLKPSNVFVTPDGTVKLLDFGVAKLVQSSDDDGTLTGAGLSPFTAAWAAPEQLMGDFVSTQSDVFSLGAILTHLLSGAPPRDMTLAREKGDAAHPVRLASLQARLPSQIAESTSLETATARGFASVDKLVAALRGELDAIAGMATHVEPERRYMTAEALREDVHRFLRRERVLAKPDSAAYRVTAFVRRQRVLSAAIVTVFTVILVASGVAWRAASATRAEARRAERATNFLSGLVTGSNATSYDPLVRLAPGGTLAQLLDSALVRIPREFSDDARIRARLYLAIGANLVTQQRIERALPVLDSAQRLAATAYGILSPEYARATLEYAAQRLEFDGPDAVRRSLEDADAVSRAYRGDHELAARIALVRAAQAMQLGRVSEADSLARQVLDKERGRPRSMLSLRAEAMRLYTSSWLQRDPRIYLRRSRAVQALADSLGLVGTNEQSTAQSAEFEALLVLGRAEAAEQLLQRMREQVSSFTDTSAVNRSRHAYQRAYLARVAGDATAMQMAVTDLRRATQAAPLLTSSDWLLYIGMIVNEALARGDTTAALSAAHDGAARLRATASPMILGFASWYLGQAQLAAQHPDEALSAVAEGERWISKAPELSSVLPLLRRVQVGALRSLGRTAEADSVQASVPKPGAIARCTPGGDWNGCPDSLE